MKLTPWFPGDIKPVHIGVYQRDHSVHAQPEDLGYCLWNGEIWMVWEYDIEDASKSTLVSNYQNLPWRGTFK